MSRSMGKGTALRMQMSRVNSRTTLTPAHYDPPDSDEAITPTNPDLHGPGPPPRTWLARKLRETIRRRFLPQAEVLRGWSMRVLIIGFGCVVITVIVMIGAVEVAGAGQTGGGRVWPGWSKVFGRNTADEVVMKRDRPLRYGPLLKRGPWLIGLVADLDRQSWRGATNGTRERWVSFYKRGELVLGRMPTVRWIDEVVLDSRVNEGRRGMELSELTWFRGKLYTVDDRTGVLYEILAPRGGLDGEKKYRSSSLLDRGLPKVVRRLVLADGNGDEPNAFKAEWMVSKEGNLYVGSHGRELTDPYKGTIKSYNPMWVKVIDQNMKVRHQNWGEQYNKLRAAARCPFPGYLMHEGALWSTRRRQWVFFPRRRSTSAYDAIKNEQAGWNQVIFADEAFRKVTVFPIKGLAADSTKGFSSAKFVPGSDENEVVAIRTIERDAATPRETGSFLTVFNLDSGTVILPETLISKRKYEGLEFLYTRDPSYSLDFLRVVHDCFRRIASSS